VTARLHFDVDLLAALEADAQVEGDRFAVDFELERIGPGRQSLDGHDGLQRSQDGVE